MYLIFASKLGFIGDEILTNFIVAEFGHCRECVQSSPNIDETSKNFIIENIRQMEEALIFGNESIGFADEEKINQLLCFVRNNLVMQMPLKLRLIIHHAFC